MLFLVMLSAVTEMQFRCLLEANFFLKAFAPLVSMSLGFRIATSTLSLNEAVITSFLVLQMGLSRDAQDATGSCIFVVKCVC